MKKRRCLARSARIEFSDFEMRGVVARRRVAFFGATYDRGDAQAPPIPGVPESAPDAIRRVGRRRFRRVRDGADQ